MTRPPIGALWGWVQTVTGRTATDSLLPGPALVLSPHQDDETIGCGLLMAKKLAQGTPVAVAVATDGCRGWFSPTPRPAPDEIAAIRHLEWHRALDALTVPRADRVEFGLPDGELPGREDELVDRIVELVAAVSPTQVFVTKSGDPHPDHQTLARAARRAVARIDRRPRLFAYRVYPGEGLRSGGDRSRLSVATAAARFAGAFLGRRDRALLLRAPEFVSTKAAAVAAYDSQSRLLAGELRYVWGTGVELYWPMDAPVHEGAESPFDGSA